MIDPVRAPLRFVHPRRCLNRHPIQAGEVRRLMAPANPPRHLFGYDLGCPGCGFPACWAVTDDGAPPIEEGPPIEDAAPVEPGEDAAPLVAFWRPAWVRSARRVPCKRCGRVLALEGDALVAYPPNP